MARRRGRQKGRSIDGIVVLDKASGLSSNAALQEVKRLYEARKAGHTGSLDPLATGVLPLCLGEATKMSQFLLDSDKGYRTRIKLGVRTSSGDSEGEVIEHHDSIGVSREQIESALENFRGEIEQLPPMYSALKKDGVPLYKLARQGKTVEREPRQVSIYSIELTAFIDDELELEIECSKGTYIRAIADDLGQALGCGAHVVALHRTRAGSFTDKDSIKFDELIQEKEANGLEGLDRLLCPMDMAVANLPQVRLPEITASQVKHGQAVLVRHLPAEGLVRLYEEEQFIGIGVIDEDGKVAPKRLVVNADQ
ncbi:MAG: tRNA pseudouridine(55) synthase TruB [Pseudomonadales bacterium]|nr:tRNA pseudouridine(55) synthase TruB [Pseudomonadales bacterium]